MKPLQEVARMSELQPDPVLQAYAQKRAKYPPEELLGYAGQWIAWSPNATRIVACAQDRRELRRLVREAGEDPQQCVVERIPLAPAFPLPT